MDVWDNHKKVQKLKKSLFFWKQASQANFHASMMASTEMQLTIPNMAARCFFKGLHTKKGQKKGVKKGHFMDGCSQTGLTDPLLGI